jgi:hypothetical protein
LRPVSGLDKNRAEAAPGNPADDEGKKIIWIKDD